MWKNGSAESIENRIYREEFTGKKCKTAILLYCFHTAGVLHIFMLSGWKGLKKFIPRDSFNSSLYILFSMAESAVLENKNSDSFNGLETILRCITVVIWTEFTKIL